MADKSNDLVVFRPIEIDHEQLFRHAFQDCTWILSQLPICGVTGKVEASTYFTGNLRHLSSEDVLIFRAR